jgi:5-methyltetrahydrofolate--homocysteine methyltransferase
LVRELSGAVDLPILAEPNAGSPELLDGKPKYMDGPDVFFQKLPELIDAGARVIGGCCGTTPETIREMRRALDQR